MRGRICEEKEGLWGTQPGKGSQVGGVGADGPLEDEFEVPGQVRTGGMTLKRDNIINGTG